MSLGFGPTINAFCMIFANSFTTLDSSQNLGEMARGRALDQGIRHADVVPWGADFAICAVRLMNMNTNPPTQIEIRAVRASDEGEWRALWRDYLAFYETELAESIYRETFARICSDAEPEFQGALACRGSTPVGLVHYLFHAHFWKPEGVCYLQDLFVKPDARGQGVARALITSVYEAADAAGRPSVYWMTQDFNSEARKLYDRIGTCTPFIKYARH